MNENKNRIDVMTLRIITLEHISKSLILLLMCGLVMACGKKESAEKASQSIASVNGEDITFLQLNNELQRARVKPEQQTQAEKQIIEKLVNRQILVQESLKAKLDRDPLVMQAIENAKMQILAQSYLENKTASVPKPSDAEIIDYRSNHADIFANRKVYIMDQLVFTANASHDNALETLSNTAKTIEDVTKWLNEHQVTYAQAKEAHPAETLPPDFLTKLSKMATGDLIFFKTNGRIMVSRMADIQDKPISEADSKPIIERILSGQKRKLIADAEMNRLRSAANITYINKKFEPTSQNASQEITKPTSPNKKDAPAEPSTPTAVLKPAESGKTADHIEKGLSGL
jgi:peptidyl-prolyl cis-trans isomerase C